MARPKKVIEACNGHRTKEEIEARKKNQNKIKPKKDNIKCPNFLDKEAKKEFKKVAKELLELDLLSNIDTATLVIYADAYSNYMKATKSVQEEGQKIEYTNSRGATNTIENPSVQIQHKYSEKIMKCSTKLGLSISDRLRLVVPTPDDKPKNKFLEFLNGG